MTCEQTQEPASHSAHTVHARPPACSCCHHPGLTCGVRPCGVQLLLPRPCRLLQHGAGGTRLHRRLPCAADVLACQDRVPQLPRELGHLQQQAAGSRGRRDFSCRSPGPAEGAPALQGQPGHLGLQGSGCITRAGSSSLGTFSSLASCACCTSSRSSCSCRTCCPNSWMKRLQAGSVCVKWAWAVERPLPLLLLSRPAPATDRLAARAPVPVQSSGALGAAVSCRVDLQHRAPGPSVGLRRRLCRTGRQAGRAPRSTRPGLTDLLWGWQAGGLELLAARRPERVLLLVAAPGPVAEEHGLRLHVPTQIKRRLVCCGGSNPRVGGMFAARGRSTLQLAAAPPSMMCGC
jgi:hypothetical protein